MAGRSRSGAGPVRHARGVSLSFLAYDFAMLTKSHLRKRLLERRRQLDDRWVDTATVQLHRRLWAWPLFQEAGGIFVYVSHQHEAGTHQLIANLLSQSKQVCVPRVVDAGVMQVVTITQWDDLVPGRYGILEPKVALPACDVRVDMALVPCVGVTQSGARLGMGGGFYDRYLAKHQSTCAVALAYDWQVVNQLPVEPHDALVDWIVTPTQCIEVI